MKYMNKNACLGVCALLMVSFLPLAAWAVPPEDGKGGPAGGASGNADAMLRLPRLFCADATRPGAPFFVWLDGFEGIMDWTQGSLGNKKSSSVPAEAAVPAQAALEDSLLSSVPALSILWGRVVLQTETGRILCSGPLFRTASGLFGCILAIPCDAPASDCQLVFLNAFGQNAAPPQRVTVNPRSFVSEDIALDSKNTDIREKPDPAKTAEAERLWTIYLTSDADAVYLDGPFILPTGKSRRSAGFNDQRRYLYSSGSSAASVHAGVDIAVPQGTRVRAAGRGRVVFAAMRIVTGNTVIVEHLPGVYSLYFHLSRIETKEGAFVKRGQEIGLSGMTGLATGPHLHWELRVRGEAADPDCMLENAGWYPAPAAPGLVLSH